MKNIYSLVVLTLLYFNSSANGTWLPSISYNGGFSDQSFYFTVNNKGYVGGGRTAWNVYKDDFWEFDPIANSWTQKADYGGGAKSAQLSFTINGKAYVGCGLDTNGYHNDFWEYDPITNVWLARASFSGSSRYSGAGFTVNGLGYFACGWNGSGLSDIWSYNPITDTWTAKNNFPGGGRSALQSFNVNGIAYLVNGLQSGTELTELWQYDDLSDSWSMKTSFPGSARYGGSTFVIGNVAYVGLGKNGSGNHFLDFYAYNSINDSWTQISSFTGVGRSSAFSFTLNNIGYVGTGTNGPDPSPNMLDDVWAFESTGDQNLIQGHEYIDFNSNNIQDSLEPSLINKKVIESNSGNIAFTNQNGFYSLAVDDTGNYVVMPLDTISYFAPVPADYNVNFSSMLQVDSLNDFAFQASGTFNDLCIGISPTNNFRSGMDGSYLLSYTNLGNTVLNSTVVLYPDTNVTFVSAVPVPTSITPDSIVFDIGDINPFQSGQIFVTVNVDSGLTIGTIINSSALILPVVGDANPTCNLAFWEVLTTGSYDPNDILVNRNFIYDYEVPDQPVLEYLIRFQNTGNDTAFTVRVMNTIDTIGVELNSFEFVASSHPATITWIPAESSMRFLFNNILLADSNINEPMSHGFIRYKITPKSNLLVGDSITSQAFIYFDFNTAVATNVARTDIIIPSGIQEQSNNAELSFYPNPVNSLLTIEVNSGKEKNISVELYNLFGQKIRNVELVKNSGNFTRTIDVSDLTSGIYFIKIPETNAVKKFVKY